MYSVKWLAAICVFVASSASQALTVTVQASTPATSNCVPFGCPGYFGPHMGFVYRNLPAMLFSPGDTIAFDVHVPNNVALTFDISLAATTVNGGYVPAGAFTQVVSNAAPPGNPYGDNKIGTFDLAYTLTSGFAFGGGGLIIDLHPTGAAANDTSLQFNLVDGAAGDPSGLFVGRYHTSTYAGAPISDKGAVGNVQFVTSAVPEPQSFALLAFGIAAIGLAVRRSRPAT